MAQNIPAGPQTHPKPSALAKNITLLRTFLRQIPLIVRVVLMHILGLSTQSHYWDLRSEVIISVIRSFIAPRGRSVNIERLQRMTIPDAKVKGSIWVSTYTSRPPPETSARDVLMQVIDDLMPEHQEKIATAVPEFANVEGEWTAHSKQDATDDHAAFTDEEIYVEMMYEANASPTVLYLHGGGYYLMDPVTHRPTAKKISNITGGRCYSVRYRLSPGHAFPSALLDAFVSYLTLLYPPPDAYHEPVKARDIVFAGDSAGGNLSFGLLRLVLELNRRDIRVKWHGEEREIPIPAAVAGNSPWLDLTHSLVALGGEKSASFDYLSMPQGGASWVKNVEECTIWPPSQPRKNFYANDHLLAHPLVSPVVNTDWTGCPPMYICCGWEILGSEAKYFSKKMQEAGHKIVFEEYEAMPHCFAMLLPNLPGANRCFQGWAGFIKDAVKTPSDIKTSAVRIRAKTLKEEPLVFEDLIDCKEDEIQSLVELNASRQVVAKL